MSGILIDVNARTSQSEKDLARINQSLKNIEGSTNAASKALNTAFAGLSATLLSGGALLALRNISNEFTNIENKVALVTGRTQELLTVQRKLFEISEQTRGSLTGTVTVFSSFGRSLKDVGVSTQNILKATKTVQEAVALSGASAEAASAALVQLGQGLSAGALRGEELNSVLEQTPRIATAIADELGVTVGKMRLLAAEGRLTSNVVFSALLNQAQKISDEFATLTPTISQSTNLLTDSIKIYISQLDKGLGISASISKALIGIAKVIKNSSDDAFEVGNRLSLGIFRARTAITSILGPLSKIGIELGKQLLNILPTGSLTRTLIGDFRQIVRTVDKELLGGLLTSFNKLKFIDLITIESDVQKAIRKLKRLSPSNWAAVGFDTKSVQQFFSRENLVLYADAFADVAKAITANTTSIGSVFVTVTRQIDGFFKAFSRYFGFRPDTIIAFTRGQVDTFFVTLSEITRGVTGIGVKIFEFSKLITDNLLPGVSAFGLAIKDALFSLPSLFSIVLSGVLDLSSKLISIVTQIIKEISYSELEFNFKEILSNMIGLFSDFVSAIEEKTKLSGPLDKIKDFGQRVIEVFRNIYDKVIGNSWWTDTVNTVVDTSNSLWRNAAAGLNSFKNNSIRLFKDVFKTVSSFELDFSKIKISSKSILPTLSSSGFIETFLDAFKKLKEVAIDFFEAFPNIAKAAIVATSGLLVYNLFPASVLKTIILSSILTSLATSGTLIAEKFGAVLTGGSLAATVGYALGQGVGFFVNSFLKDLPNILNTILGFISNFFRGVTEKLPILGDFISGIFSIASSLGVAGPAGVLGAYFFGKNLGLFKLLGKLEPIKSFLEFFEIKLDDEKDDKKKGKAASTGLLEKAAGAVKDNVGTARATSIGLLLAQGLGAFDSIFANSVLAKYATTGGLLYTTLFGQEGVNKIVDFFERGIIKPFGDSLKTFADKAGGVTKNVYEILFGDTGTVGERLGLVIRPAIDRITERLVDFAAPVLEKSANFLKTLLLGKNPTRTIRLLKVEAGRLIQDFFQSVSKISKPIIQPVADFLDNRRYQSWLRRNANPQQPTGQSSFDQFADQAGRTAERVGGEKGLLGKLFLGKYSKQILVGSILAVGTAFAFAAENAKQASEESPFERLVNDVKGIDLLGPFKQLSAEVTLFIVPAIIGAFILLRTQLLAIFTEIKLAGAAAMSAAGLGGIVGAGGRRARNKPSPIVTTGLAAAGGVAAGAFFDSAALGLQIGLALIAAFEIAVKILPAKLLKIFSFAGLGAVLRTAVALLFSKLTLSVLAIGSVLGAAYVWLFGETGKFFTDLQTAIDKTKEFFGLQPTPKPSARGLSREDEAFIKSRKLETKFNLDNVDLKKLEEKDLQKLQERTKEFADTLKLAREDEAKYGRITPERQEELRILDKGLQDLSNKLALRISKQVSPVKAIEDLTILNPQQRSAQFVSSAQQTVLDVLYSLNDYVLRVSRDFAPTQELKLARTLEIDQLKKLKDTQYNAFYRPLRDSEKALLDLAKSAETVSFTNDQLENDLVKVRQQYEKNASIVKGREISVLGQFRALPENDADAVALRITELQYIEKLKAKVEFDRQQKAIKAFTSDINVLQTTFKDVLSLDLGEIFAVDQQDLFKLKELEKQARFLGEQIKNVSDIAQKNEITLRITEIRRQVVEIQERAKIEINPLRPQFVLKELYDKAGIRRPEEFFENLSDSAAKALASAAQQYNQTLESAKNKPVSPQLAQSEQLSNILKGQYPPPAVPELPQFFARVGTSLKDVEANARAQLRSIEAAEKDAIRGTVGELEVFKTQAEKLGLSAEQLITKYGVKTAIGNAEKLNNLVQQLDAARRSRDDSRIASLTKRIELFREELTRVPLDFPGILGQISSGGVAITAEDVVNTKGILPELRSVANEFLQTEISFKQLGNSFSEVDIQAILQKKLEASRRLFNVFIRTIANTPNKIFDIFSKFGLSDPNQVLQISDNAKSLILDLEKVRATLEELGKRAATPQEFIFITALRAKLEAATEYLKNKFSKTFASTFQKINSTLDLNLSEGQFANLPEQLTNSLLVYSDFLDRNLENIRKKGSSIAGETPKEFFAKFDEALRNVKFVKFIADLNASIAAVATDGLKTQFEKFSEAVGESAFTKETFAELPKALRTQLTQRALALKGIESALDLPGLTDKQLGILGRLSTEPGNEKAILDAFIKDLSANLSNLPAQIKDQQAAFLAQQLTPIDRQINSLDNVSVKLNELKIELQTLISRLPSVAPVLSNAPIEGKAEGGWISGPGTGTSDSILTRLSKGEFVINAKSAKKNARLLEQLNKNIPAFNEGGFLGLWPTRNKTEVDRLEELLGYKDEALSSRLGEVAPSLLGVAGSAAYDFNKYGALSEKFQKGLANRTATGLGIASLVPFISDDIRGALEYKLNPNKDKDASKLLGLSVLAAEVGFPLAVRMLLGSAAAGPVGLGIGLTAATAGLGYGIYKKLTNKKPLEEVLKSGLDKIPKFSRGGFYDPAFEKNVLAGPLEGRVLAPLAPPFLSNFLRPETLTGSLTDFNTLYADFTPLEVIKQKFKSDIERQFGNSIESLTEADQKKLRLLLDQYYENQIQTYQNVVQRQNLDISVRRNFTPQTALESSFGSITHFTGNPGNISQIGQTLRIPNIATIPNIKAANAIKAHELGHMLSFGRTFDIESILANLNKSPSFASSISLLNTQLGMLYETNTSDELLRTFGGSSFLDPMVSGAVGQFKGNLKLLEETNANNIGSYLSPIGDIWESNKGFKSYQIEDRFTKLRNSDLNFLTKTLKAAPDILDLSFLGPRMMMDLAKPTPSIDSQARTGKLSDILKATGEKASSLGTSFKDKFSRKFANTSNDYGVLKTLANSVGKATSVFDVLSQFNSDGEGAALMATISNAIVGKNPIAGFQLLTYAKDALGYTDDFAVLKAYEDNKLAQQRQETSKALYKPNIKSSIKRPDITRKLVNFEDYLSSSEITDKNLQNSFGFTAQQLKELNKINGSMFLRKAAGGVIRGPGSGMSDSIPAWVSNGEFIVNAEATKKNFKLLEAINSAKRFQTGGPVGTVTPSITTPEMPSASTLESSIIRAIANGFNAIKTAGGEGISGVSKVLFRAKTLSLDMDELKFRALEPAAQKEFETLVNKAYEDRITAGQKKTPELIKQAAKSLDDVENFIEQYLPKFTNKVREAGVEFANNIGAGFNDAVRGLLKGQADADKSVWTTFRDRLLDTVTNNIIDTFVKGLMDPLTGKNGILTKIFSDLGENLFSGGSIFTGLFASFYKKRTPEEAAKIPVETRTPVIKEDTNLPVAVDTGPIPVKPTAVDQQQLTATQTIGAGITGLVSLTAGAALMQGDGFQKLIGILTITNGILTLIKAFAAIDAIPFLASGGMVKGPGTGTSDSISAMLSNGEFVVNANATKNNLGLLTAINNGSMKKFAEGGLVSTAMVAAPSLATIKSTKNSNANSQQVVNINITGDISRQTRAQIYQMLPSIAEGVNAQNRERGYRG